MNDADDTAVAECVARCQDATQLRLHRQLAVPLTEYDMSGLYIGVVTTPVANLPLEACLVQARVRVVPISATSTDAARRNALTHAVRFDVRLGAPGGAGAVTTTTAHYDECVETHLGTFVNLPRRVDGITFESLINVRTCATLDSMLKTTTRAWPDDTWSAVTRVLARIVDASPEMFDAPPSSSSSSWLTRDDVSRLLAASPSPSDTFETLLRRANEDENEALETAPADGDDATATATNDEEMAFIEAYAGDFTRVDDWTCPHGDCAWRPKRHRNDYGAWSESVIRHISTLAPHREHVLAHLKEGVQCQCCCDLLVQGTFVREKILRTKKRPAAATSSSSSSSGGQRVVRVDERSRYVTFDENGNRHFVNIERNTIVTRAQYAPPEIYDRIYGHGAFAAMRAKRNLPVTSSSSNKKRKLSATTAAAAAVDDDDDDDDDDADADSGTASKGGGGGGGGDNDDDDDNDSNSNCHGDSASNSGGGGGGGGNGDSTTFSRDSGAPNGHTNFDTFSIDDSVVARPTLVDSTAATRSSDVCATPPLPFVVAAAAVVEEEEEEVEDLDEGVVVAAATSAPRATVSIGSAAQQLSSIATRFERVYATSNEALRAELDQTRRELNDKTLALATEQFRAASYRVALDEIQRSVIEARDGLSNLFTSLVASPETIQLFTRNSALFGRFVTLFNSVPLLSTIAQQPALAMHMNAASATTHEFSAAASAAAAAAAAAAASAPLPFYDNNDSAHMSYLVQTLINSDAHVREVTQMFARSDDAPPPPPPPPHDYSDHAALFAAVDAPQQFHEPPPPPPAPLMTPLASPRVARRYVAMSPEMSRCSSPLTLSDMPSFSGFAGEIYGGGGGGGGGDSM